MEIRLDGKVALVTGASSGIGHAAARALGESGTSVCVQGLTHMAEAETLADTIVQGGGNAIALRADVTNQHDVDLMVRTVVDTFGGLDIAVNNAGTFRMASLEETTDELWDHHLTTNLTSAFYCSRRVVPEMKRRGRGKLIQTGSIFGTYGVPNAVAYCTSKIALHGLTRALAIELAPFHINVNAIGPGSIVTPLNNAFYDAMAAQAGQPGNREAGKQEVVKSYPWGRLGNPADVAPAVVYLASEASDFVTGQIFFVDGGYTAC